MSDTRPWKLVAPWYRWRRQTAAGQAQGVRGTRPDLQKFDQSDFVNGFMADPQRSLKFKDDVDQVFAVHLVPAPPLSFGPFAGKSVTFFAPKTTDGVSHPRRASLVPQGIKKIFLETHKRYYIVVCELHCDAPGLPRVDPEKACQAGLVVRRRLLQYPAGGEKEALRLLREIVAVEAEIADLDLTSPARGSAARKRAARVEKLKAEGTFDALRAELSAKLADKRAELLRWRDDNGVASIKEGWVRTPFAQIGEWQVAEETPAELREEFFPLFPLFAPPDKPEHDAQGHSLYFGMVPTSSLDTDASGRPRFDDRSIYEMRCFVRHHDPECPRTEEEPDCCGPLVWSEPTEPYRLASQSDLVGTANRPVTIQMPDLAELAAQAAHLPLGRFSPMRFRQPRALQPQVGSGPAPELKDGSVGGLSICFFAIPLITIIALFLLTLFLPIVVLLFGLWFLLALKFCIPPSFQIDGALEAELNLALPDVTLDVDARLDVDLQVQIGGVTIDTGQLHTKLTSKLGADIDSSHGLPPGTAKPGLETFANSALVPLGKSFATIARLPADVENDPSVGLDLVAGLEYEERESRAVAEAMLL
jgi:hypothetical protein